MIGAVVPTGPRRPSSLGYGAGYPWRSLVFIQRHRLWGLVAVPALVNVVIVAVLVAVSYRIASPLLGVSDRFISSIVGDATHWFAWVMQAVRWLVWLLVIGSLLLVCSLVLGLLGPLLASPFLDRLSEKVEIVVRGVEPPPSNLASILSGIGLALSDLVVSLFVWGVGSLLLLLLHLVPVVGSLIHGVLGAAFTALVLAQEFLGLTPARHQIGYWDRWRRLRGYRATALGFGLMTLVLPLIPGLNLILLPLATVGGTLLYLDIVGCDVKDKT